MCGILVLGWNSAYTQGPTAETRHFSTADFADCLATRGPDQQGETKVQSQGPLENCSCRHTVLPAAAVTQVHAGSGATLQMCGSLLQLRGCQASHTPLEDSAGNVLLFNGARPPCAGPALVTWPTEQELSRSGAQNLHLTAPGLSSPTPC